MTIYPSHIISCRSVSIGGVMHTEFEIGGDANASVGEALPTAPGMRGIKNMVLGIKRDTHSGAVISPKGVDYRGDTTGAS
jgi:hypothetical protein